MGCGTGGTLSLDDFNIYENGNIVMKSTDLESGSTYYSALQTDDFKGRALETKRGIKIGSSAREVAEAYKGIVSPVLYLEAGGEKLTLEEYLDAGNKEEDYIAAFDVENGGKRYILNFHIGGNAVEDISFLISEINS